MRGWLKQALFALLGKDPEGVVVVCDPRLTDEMRRLVPDRRILPWPGRSLRRYRVAQVAVMFDGRWPGLRVFFLGPILAFHPNLERHQLSWRCPIASLLFVLGTPLDRIYLRPWWLGGGEKTIRPQEVTVIPGRPPAPGRKRIGILTPYLPYPLAHGGAVRIFNLLREGARDFDLTLFAFVEEPGPVAAGPLPDWCEKIILVPKPRYREPRWSSWAPPEVEEYESPAMRRALAAHPLDLLQVEYTQLARYPGHVLVEHDVTFDLQKQVEAQSPTVSHRWNRWRWERFERAAVSRFPATVVMSDKDRALLGQGTVIANGVDLERYQPSPEPPGRRLLFIGSFRHFPNVTGLRWFLDEVWPLLADVDLDIVAGPQPDLYWAMPSLPRIQQHSFVEDVRPLYYRANVVIVPTLVSAGTNVKVLEAMAMERAVVSTPSGAGGLGLVDGESIVLGATPQEFALGILRLLENDAERHAIARAGRRIAQESFGWQALGERQAALWKSC
ncbi:MAG: glycosyltransferase family 4 protein [Bryobacteraceae bacterium]|nr:glycosyltransferase family 4 protein [Bryobacteraceae bacterium]